MYAPRKNAEIAERQGYIWAENAENEKKISGSLPWLLWTLTRNQRIKVIHGKPDTLRGVRPVWEAAPWNLLMKVSKAQGAYLISDADAQFLCGHRPERECETFQSEKDWHISTESLFIVMKLVRVGELNAWIVEWRGNALKDYSNTPAGMEMSKHWNVRSPVKSAERYRNNSSWRKLSRGGWCILYAGSL